MEVKYINSKYAEQGRQELMSFSGKLTTKRKFYITKTSDKDFPFSVKVKIK